MEIVDSHSRADDQNAFVSQTFQCLTHAVMLVRVLVVEQRKLHDRYIQWVLLRIKSCPGSASATRYQECLRHKNPSRTSHKAHPDAMVKASFDSLNLNPSTI